MQEKWLSIGEVSERTGKTTAAIRMWIKRRTKKGTQIRVKKERRNHCESWLIHSSEISKLDERVYGENSGELTTELTNIVTLDRYEAMRKELENEREQAIQGMMMYRYKYEELDRKMRLLPAPPEMINEEIRKRNEITEQTRKELSQTQSKLVQVQEKLTSDIREKKQAIEKAQEIIRDAQEKNEQYESSLTEIQQKLQEEEQTKEALIKELEKERARSWWKRLFGIK